MNRCARQGRVFLCFFCFIMSFSFPNFLSRLSQLALEDNGWELPKRRSKWKCHRRLKLARQTCISQVRCTDLVVIVISIIAPPQPPTPRTRNYLIQPLQVLDVTHMTVYFSSSGIQFPWFCLRTSLNHQEQRIVWHFFPKHLLENKTFRLSTKCLWEFLTKWQSYWVLPDFRCTAPHTPIGSLPPDEGQGAPRNGQRNDQNEKELPTGSNHKRTILYIYILYIFGTSFWLKKLIHPQCVNGVSRCK